MDLPSEVNPSLKKDPRSTSKIIKNIHSMPWLRKADGAQNVAFGKDGKFLSMKKTDEDYFSGTREEKKLKKKKEKRGKSVLTLDDLQDLVISSLQQDENEITAVTHSQEAPKFDPTISQKDTELASETNTTVWSTTASAADKLFPNVQSVVIDRLEEEEMLSRAIAESIATVQLEQFKKHSPEKGNRWEALYGDNDDESGWDNVRSNLPPALESTTSWDTTSGQRKICDDNNNSDNNTSSKSGILKMRRKNLEPDICFKTSSENSDDETKSAKSVRSVSFDESVDVKIRSTESSVSDESHEIITSNQKLPNIDKFGRVDGYSERRLFMGKGARMREQEYIQNNCSLGTTDVRQENLEPKLKGMGNIQKKEPEIAMPKNDLKKPVEVELQKIVLELPKIADGIAVKDSHGTTKVIRRNGGNIKKSQPSSPKSHALDKRSSKWLISRKNSSEEFFTLDSSVAKIKSVAANTVKSKEIVIQALEETRNLETSCEVESKTFDDKDIKKEQIYDPINGLPLSGTQASNSGREIHSPLQREETIRKKEINTSQDTMVESLAAALRIDDDINAGQIQEEEIRSENQCLVPILIEHDRYTENSPKNPTASPSYTDFQRAAHQNLLLVGLPDLDLNCNTQNLVPRNSNPQNLDYQDYSILDSVCHDTIPQQSQNLDNAQYIKPKCTNSGNQIYQNAMINELPNSNCNAYPIHPYYQNATSDRQMDHEGYTHSLHELLAQNLLYQNRLMNPSHYTEVTTDRRTMDHRDKFSTRQPAPGLIKKLQLPPGFTRKESPQTHYGVDEKNSVNQNMQKFAYGKGKINTENSVPQRADNSWYKTSSQSKNHGQMVVESPNVFANKKKVYHVSQTGFECRESKSPDDRRIPYPILGAGRHLPKFYRDNSIVRSSNCKSPNEKYQRSSNWRYNVNLIDQPELPTNFPPNYQIPLQNQPNFPANVPPDYFETLIHQNANFQQMPMQMSMYPCPNVMNAEGNGAYNVRPEDVELPEMNSTMSHDQPVQMLHESILRSEMQQASMGARSYADYNLNRTEIPHFVSNSNFYGTEYHLPNIQDEQNLRNDQTNRTTGLISDNVTVGRGRGRLIKKNLR